MIKLEAIGNLVRDSELKTTPQGKTLLKFTIAASHGFGDYKKTTFVNCIMWGERGEKLVNHFTKGTKLWVSGDFELREYEKNDGGKGYSPDLNVRDFEFAGKSQISNSDNAVNDAKEVFEAELDAPLF